MRLCLAVLLISAFPILAQAARFVMPADIIHDKDALETGSPCSV